MTEEKWKSKRLIPKIVIVKGNLPSWFASPLAAYHWSERTIWLNSTVSKQAFIYYFFHELGHHLIEVITKSHKIHDWYDRVCYKLFCKKNI